MGFQELESITNKHETRHNEERNKRYTFAGFFEFFRKNKQQLTTILISFVTVIMAVQIVKLSENLRESERRRGEIENELNERKTILGMLATNDSETVSQMARHCADDVIDKDDIVIERRKKKDTSSSSSKSLWSLLVGGIEFSDQDDDDDDNEIIMEEGKTSLKDDIEESIRLILQQKLQDLIGDLGLTAEEISAKEFQQLTKQNHNESEAGMNPTGTSSSSSSSSDDEILKSLVQQQEKSKVEEEIRDDKMGTTKIMKKKVFTL